MAEGSRPHVVEHAQTEFGSKLFHDKIGKQHDGSHTVQTEPALPSISSGSKFILPLRESRVSDVETVKPAEKKKSFFNLRPKISLRNHSKPQPAAEVVDVFVPPVRSSTESARKRFVFVPSVSLSLVRGQVTNRCSPSLSLPLDRLFQTLPTELQTQVIAFLPLPDVLNLRLTSKSWHALVTRNEIPIVRHHLEHNIPAYARRLYPVTDSSELNFHYLCGLWHRLHVAAKLSFLITEWITKDFFLRQTEIERIGFAGQHERMRRRLIPLLFTIFHFFETYRKLHLEHIAQHGGHGLTREPYTMNPIELKIMNMYDNQTLLRVHEVFPLVISSFCRRLRPPTYVGRVERSLRGYIREKPSDEIHSAILCVGGLRQVERLWEIKGYNSRRSAVDHWYNNLTREAPPEPTQKTRRSLMGFGRKKSTSGESHEYHTSRDQRASFSSLHRTRSPANSFDGSEYGDVSWIFNTSLSAGAPMDSLTRDQAQTILDDLPVLQDIWMRTAEALILQRQIVGRASDIKRNQQLLLDLIREEGMNEEDEWCYGRNIPDSVRPRNIAADDDAD